MAKFKCGHSSDLWSMNLSVTEEMLHLAWPYLFTVNECRHLRMLEEGLPPSNHR